MARPPLRLIREALADRPVLDVAVSHALLVRVARGELPPTARVARPGAMVAFGKQDAAAPGFGAAAAAARGAGFEAVVRLAGGRAAVFHAGTIAYAHAVPDPRPAEHIYPRFEETASVVQAALRRLGVDARIGQVPGEYCPGGYSVNARGRSKLAGIGQRLIKGAAHLGGVVVARDSERVRQALVPVYEALALEWDPATVGSVADEIGAVAGEDVRSAVIDELALRYELEDGALDAETLELARELEREHAAPPAAQP